LNFMPHAEREPESWPRGTQSLGFTLMFFQYTPIDTNEKKRNLRGRKKMYTEKEIGSKRGKRC